MDAASTRRQRRRPLGNYGLTIVLGIFFLSTWVGQFLVELRVVTDEAAEHGQSFEWSQFWPEFWQSTLENWQSEFLQLFTFVLLTAFLIHRGSAESKDSDEEIQEALERIERRLDQMQGAVAGSPPPAEEGGPNAPLVNPAGG